MNNIRQYLDGHIGDLILLTAFILSLVAFSIVFVITKQESNLLGAIVMGALTSLGTYMQKRATSSTTTNVETANIAKVENTTEDEAQQLDAQPNP